MAEKVTRTSWLGKIKGHVGVANRLFEADKREREAAGREPIETNIILTEREIKSGKLDAGRVLMTMLGGKPRPLNDGDLETFRRAMDTLRSEAGSDAGRGIKAQDVIDLANRRPLHYENKYDLDKGFQSDLDKARAEITQGVAVSANGGTVRFMTNAGRTSGRSRHIVIVDFLRWEDACAKVAALPKGDKAAIRRVANWLRKERLAFDCDCERHRYFFRYVASIGGFAAGRKETGYPKIRNPHLHGCACKHVLRVMTEIINSGNFLRFLTNHLENVAEYRARSQISQAEAEKFVRNRRKPTKIVTGDELKAKREAARKKAEEKRALKKVAVKPPPKPRKPDPPVSRYDFMKAAREMAGHLGLSLEEFLSRFPEYKKGA